MKIVSLKREVLRVAPETLEELLSILYFKKVAPETDEYLDLRLAFRSKEKVEIDIPGQCVKEGGGWARAEVTTDFLDLYWEQLEKRLGAHRFNFDLLPGLFMPAYHGEGYTLMYYTTSDNLVHAELACNVYPRHQGHVISEAEVLDMTLERARNSLNKRLGTVDPVPQFIPTRAGEYRHNPAYGSRPNSPRPAVADGKLLQYMANLWVDKFATPGQKEAVANFHHATPTSGWFTMCRDPEFFYTRGCVSSITVEQFKKL